VDLIGLQMIFSIYQTNEVMHGGTRRADIAMLFVRLSVRHIRYCVVTAKRIINLSSVTGSHIISGFPTTNIVTKSQHSHSQRKALDTSFAIRNFLSISGCISKTSQTRNILVTLNLSNIF